jgi:predicted transposase/invertase (TIGR01784 family)
LYFIKNPGLKQVVWEGVEKGLQKGIQKGIEKVKKDIAISLFDVLDIDIISKKTGLSIERLNQLKEPHSKQS